METIQIFPLAPNGVSGVRRLTACHRSVRVAALIVLLAEQRLPGKHIAAELGIGNRAGAATKEEHRNDGFFLQRTTSQCSSNLQRIT